MLLLETKYKNQRKWDYHSEVKRDKSVEFINERHTLRMHTNIVDFRSLPAFGQYSLQLIFFDYICVIYAS